MPAIDAATAARIFDDELAKCTTQEEADAVKLRYRQFQEQHSLTSHQDFFKNKKAKVALVEGDDDPMLVESEESARRKVQRISQLGTVVADALVNRVKAPQGDKVLHATWEEVQKMMGDPEFLPFAKYANNILYYTDGRPRATPLRPLLENEAGMYRGQIVCFKTMPEDRLAGTFVKGGLEK